jgi:hypothetical protein
VHHDVGLVYGAPQLLGQIPGALRDVRVGHQQELHPTIVLSSRPGARRA